MTARQVRKLGVISAAGVAMVQQIHQQAEHAEHLGAEGALMFARVARAVRQSVAMGRSLGAHDAACSDGQLGQLDMVSEIGAALIERLRLQIRGTDWFNGLDALMMARLAVATERTILLEQRINAERALTPDERNAAQKAHAVAARRRRPRRAGAPAGAAPGAAIPQAVAPAVLTTMVSGLAQALGENEGDADGTEAPDGAACDAALPPEDFAHPSVEAEIGGRSLAEIAEEACRLTGVAPEPGLFEAEAQGGAQTDGPMPLAAPASPGLSAPMGRRGEGDEAGVESPPITPRESRHDPPSG